MENDLKRLISKLRYSPKDQELINSIGVHYLNNKNFDNAIKYFKQNLSLNKTNYKFHFNLGVTYDELKKYDLAIFHYNEVINLNKNFELVYFKLGNLYLNLNKLNLSITYFSKSIKINAKNIFSLINRGLAYHKSQKFDNALKDFTSAIDIEENNWLALVNRGNTYRKLYEYSKAESDYKRVLRILPNNPEAFFNLAGLFQEIEKFDISMSCYNESINLNYKVDSSKYNKSLIQLLKGDLINGFKNYEFRWKTKTFLNVNKYIEIPRPKKLEEVKNKKILVFCEQGIGDIFQFSRYLIELEKICKEIIFEVPSYLVSILNNLKLNKTVIVKKYNEISEINFCIGLLSLPNLYKTNLKTIPSNIPYFKNNSFREREWSKEINSKKFNIGICWRGSEKIIGRSLNLLNFKKISLLKNINLISLQKDLTSEEKNLIKSEIDITDFNDTLDLDGAFLDSAAIINNLDLVISVDTSIAHLAGALNKKTWIILKKFPDWRWLLNKKTSPWYPKARLFRQSNYKNWDKPIEDIYRKIINEFVNK